MTFVYKTGMDAERDVVRNMLHSKDVHDDIWTITGVWSAERMDTQLPPDVEAIVSVGTCGGLCPDPMPQVGDIYTSGLLKTPFDTYLPNTTWAAHIASKLQCQGALWWSSGQFNTANDVASRTKIWRDSGAEIIDDESFSVARFAKIRNIPFVIVRAVSDTCRPEDDLPPAARNAVQQSGGMDIFEVIKSILHEHGQIKALEHCYTDLQIALAKLRVALDTLGPYCLFK